MRPLAFWWVTNIPTPYRNFNFERMHALLPKRGIDFRVLYMAWSEPRRTWQFSRDDLRYPSHVYAGIHRALAGVPMHLNPGLLFDLRRTLVDAVMVGGYSSPTHLMAPFSLHPRTASILGVETNLESEGRSHGPARWLKRRIIEKYDAYLVPQQRSRDFLVSISAKAATRPFLDFPNQVDPAVFREGVDAVRPRRMLVRQQLGVADDQQLWICPARLAPEKGLGPFLASLEGIRGVRLVVAGDGPLLSQLEGTARARGVPVSFPGNVKQEQMVELYAAADVFVLPSLADPSPLSTIEACAAGLPLLVSPRVGNFADVLDPGKNGWSLRMEPQADRVLLAEVAATRFEVLRQMGAHSRQKFGLRFDPDTCIDRLADDIVALVERKQRELG